jgi:hypothetical protein
MFMRHDGAFIVSLCPSFDWELDDLNFQFLWLIPIIEVMWADGRCQRAEAETLFHYVDRFVALAGRDIPELTGERARRFLQPFLDASVGRNPRKRAELAGLCDFIIAEWVSPARRDKRVHLFEICVDVAMAARVEGSAGRIAPEEERLLVELFRELHLDRRG